jgi:hypothetical protein
MYPQKWPLYDSHSTNPVKYINSLTRRDTWYRYFRKNMSEIPVNNGSSLNKLITKKIIALANITLIETSVSVV